MSLTPLLNAAPEVQVHAFAAMTAFVLGVVQLGAPKGTLPHRTLGWVWVVLLLVISASSFLIHGIRMWGPWSPIHILSVFPRPQPGICRRLWEGRFGGRGNRTAGL